MIIYNAARSRDLIRVCSERRRDVGVGGIRIAKIRLCHNLAAGWAADAVENPVIIQRLRHDHQIAV